MFDEAASGRRSIATQRQELRDELVRVLRDYSTKIETVRIIYIQAYDDLAAGRLLSSDYARAAWIVQGLRHLINWH